MLFAQLQTSDKGHSVISESSPVKGGTDRKACESGKQLIVDSCIGPVFLLIVCAAVANLVISLLQHWFQTQNQLVTLLTGFMDMTGLKITVSNYIAWALFWYAGLAQAEIGIEEAALRDCLADILEGDLTDLPSRSIDDHCMGQPVS
jgi:hypothetical protein